MRVLVFSAITIALSASALSAPASRPKLAGQPIFSVSQVTDVDPDGTEDEATLYGSLQTLIELFGVTGIVYEDRSVHKDWTITADEANTLLASAYETLLLISDAAQESALATTSDDDAARVINAFETVFETALSPTPSCRLVGGTKYAVATKKKTQPLKGNANVGWSQALACLPGASSMPLQAQSYGRKAVKPAVAITRGEFLHKLNEAMENGYSEIGGAGL
jgi:hypothetical protein